MELFKIHELIDQLLRKSQGGYISPEEKDRAINWAQTELFSELKPAYNAMQTVDDALMPFKKEQAFTNSTSPAGLITLNTDYLHLLLVETVVTDSDGTHYVAVEKVGEDELPDRRSSALIQLDAYSPIGVLKAGKKFQIYPAQATAGTVYYLRAPQEVQFVYTGTRPIVYNSVTSKQLEWNEPATQTIIQKAVAFLAETLQVAPLQQQKGGAD